MHRHKWPRWSEPVEETYTEYISIRFDTEPKDLDKEGRERTHEVQTRECEKCGKVEKRAVGWGYSG